MKEASFYNKPYSLCNPEEIEENQKMIEFIIDKYDLQMFITSKFKIHNEPISALLVLPCNLLYLFISIKSCDYWFIRLLYKDNGI